jgi:rhodanese-related sulfurtransferase
VDPLRITLAELDDLLRRGERVVLLDARKPDSYEASATVAQGAIRVPPPPDRAVETVSALGLPQDAWLVSYCT